MINDNIILFLSNRGWNIDYGNDVYYKATPPEIFNFDDDFSILLPRNYEKIDFVECKRTSCLCYKGL